MSRYDDPDLNDLEEGQGETSWNALEVMRARAEASRTDRDEAIGTLRESMTDDEIRDDFGIDLREIEG